MGYLRVAYVTQDLTDPDKEYQREIEEFPLKIGKYRFKKHPLFSFWLLRYEHNILTFSVKNHLYEVKVNQYMYFTYKKTSKKQIDIFFEIMDEEWIDECEEKVEEDKEPIGLQEIPDALLKVHYEESERDTYDEYKHEEDFELAAVVGTNVRIRAVEGNLLVKSIPSIDEVLLEVTGHYGKTFSVTTKEEGIFTAGDTYGRNDNFRSFSCKVTVQLIKK